MPNREVAREDLREAHVHRWGYSALFMVAVVRCAACQRSYRAISQPKATDDEAAQECLRIISREGWRVSETGHLTCQDCGAST